MQTHPAVAPVEARPEPSATEEPVATHAPSPSAEAAVLPACGVSTAPGVRLPSGTHNQLTYNRLGPHGKVSTSAQPTLAPADYASLQPMVKVCMEWDEQTSHGSGVTCHFRCEACGAGGAHAPPAEQCLRVYCMETMQRNGNSRTRVEVVCVQCRTFSVIETWEEG